MPRGKRLDPIILEAALVGLEAQRQKTEQQIAEVRTVLGDDRLRAGDEHAVRPRRRMSAAGRKRIAEAQKKRWAQVRQESKPNRKMSAAGRKRIGDAARKRWAAVRAAKQAAVAGTKRPVKAAQTARRAVLKRGGPRKAAPNKESVPAPAAAVQQ